MKVYFIQIFMGLCAFSLYLSEPEDYYMQALIVTCLFVAFLPFFIGHPGYSVQKNHEKITEEGSRTSCFLHNNLIYIFVSLTLVIAHILSIIKQ